MHLQELQQAVAARDEFITTVAHELRNPIAPLTFQLRLAIGKVGAAWRHLATPCRWSGCWRSYAAPNSACIACSKRWTVCSTCRASRWAASTCSQSLTDFAQAAREVTDTFEAELGVARSKLTFLERGVATGNWDRMRVEQICHNLLSNAIRFGAGKPIEVVVDAIRTSRRFTCAIYGIGIAADHQTRIFERFERGMEQRSGGFGIGLWVVKTICAAMGGTVAVHSQPGEGARFTVTLPRRQPRATVNAASEGT